MFGFFKKEKYINQIATTYSMIYGCDDYESIDTLRRNYSAKELKAALNTLKSFADGNHIDLYTARENNPFKEHLSF